MQYFAYSLAVWLILILCGLPLAFALLPANLRRLALPMAPVFGYSYIAFVGYFFYRSNIGGTDVYAPFLLAPPIVGLLLLIWRRQLPATLIFGRQAMLMVALTVLGFLFLSSVFMLAGGRAVSMAFSNLDIIELASVSRYLQEFARDTTIGFLGHDVSFPDTGDNRWFGPSVIVAVMSSATFSEPFRLQSLVMAIVTAQGAAFVYIIARDSLSLDRWVALTVAALYAINPVIGFTVWQSFGGQMISIALMLAVTYLVTRAQNEPAELRTQFRYLPAVVLLFSGLLVTYQFMIPIICVSLGLYISIVAIAELSIKRLWVGAALMFAAVFLTAALNPLRLIGTIDLVAMLNSGNGWFIRWISPDVQLGFDASQVLLGGSNPRWVPGLVMTCGLVLLTAWHLVGQRRRRSHLAFVLGFAVPLFLVGLYYAVKEADQEMLGSYRSFKITATFTAITLIAASLWFGAEPVRVGSFRMMAGTALAAILLFVEAANLQTMMRFANEVMYVPPEDLQQIRKIESMDHVDGINIMDDNYFDQFWAHYFTLRKRQVFQNNPYRLRGVLTEPYRLQPNATAPGAQSDIFAVQAACTDAQPINRRVSLCKSSRSFDVIVSPGAGWWGKEPAWRWSGANGRFTEVMIDNRVAGARINIKATYGELRPNNSIGLSVNDEPVPVTATATELSSGPFVLKAGRNVARFTEALDPILPEHDKRRTIGVMWKQVLIVPSDPAASEPVQP